MQELFTTAQNALTDVSATKTMLEKAQADLAAASAAYEAAVRAADVAWAEVEAERAKLLPQGHGGRVRQS